MIRIEHIALWTPDIERLKAFYEKYFEATAGNKYRNPVKQLDTYFLTFADGARLEIMHKPSVPANPKPADYQTYTHLAFSLGSEEKVNELTQKLSADGFRIIDGPRTTGDGYYESVVLDPDGNFIELTV